MNIVSIVIFVLSTLLGLTATHADFNVPFKYDCRGPIDNDEMAEYCALEAQDLDGILQNIGLRRVFHSFETISKELNSFPEIEEQYDLILMTNTDVLASKSPSDFIPPQTMIVLKKAKGAKSFFTRNSQGVITGLAPGTLQLSQIIGTGHRDKITKNSSKNYGMPYTYKGLEVVPVSTGSSQYMLSFSGIFQINWERSRDLPRRAWSNPMSNPLYFGYYYTYANGKRERISYAASHGTPKQNWDLLGKDRASHGCTRVHPAVMEDVRAVVESMDQKNVFEFNWDYELPVQDQSVPYRPRKPVLMITFDGYEGKSAIQNNAR